MKHYFCAQLHLKYKKQMIELNRNRFNDQLLNFKKLYFQWGKFYENIKHEILFTHSKWNLIFQAPKYNQIILKAMNFFKSFCTPSAAIITFKVEDLTNVSHINWKKENNNNKMQDLDYN